MSGADRRHVLLVEPRTEGHHLTWLRYIAEDLLAAGFQVSAATCPEPPPGESIEEQVSEIYSELKRYPLTTQTLRSQSGLHTVLEIATRAGAKEVFFNSFDEIASRLLRRAAFGLFPPKSMERTGGIYFRPRFLQHGFSFQNWIKRAGLTRLVQRQVFNRLLLLDENLLAIARRDLPTAPFYFLPDPHPANFKMDAAPARTELRLGLSRRVFLFYGGPYRRKGMHLTAEAFLQIDHPSPALLLYAGQPPDDPKLLTQLRELERRGMAQLILRRVSDREEKLLFAAADFVLLPYIGHFGSSGVLSRAVGAHKPVIASDEQLVGRRVRQHELGLLFSSGKVEALKKVIVDATTASEKQLERWRNHAASYAPSCSREAFRAALLESFKS